MVLIQERISHEGIAKDAEENKECLAAKAQKNHQAAGKLPARSLLFDASCLHCARCDLCVKFLLF